MKIKIDPEFAKLIPNVGLDGELEREILDDEAVFEPLIVWSHQNILLDGHRRHGILAKHPTLKAPKPIVLDLEDRQAAHDWIIRHQLSKRNVTEEQRTYLIGKLYYDTKKQVGRPNVDTVSTLNDGKTAEKIAEQEGVSERTVRRAGEFAEAVDSVPEEVKEAVLSGAVAGATKDLEALGELSKAKQKKAAKAIKEKKVKSVKAAVASVSEPEDAPEEPTFAESIDEENKLIESFCRSLVKFYEDHAPQLTWTKDSGRIDSALSNVKAACATLRSAKAVACPACTEGQNKKGKCGYCKGHGYLPSQVEKTIPEAMRL